MNEQEFKLKYNAHYDNQLDIHDIDYAWSEYQDYPKDFDFLNEHKTSHQTRQ